MVAQRQGTGVAADEPAKDSVEVKADIQVEVKVEGDEEKTDSRKRKNDSDDHPAKRKKTTHKVNLVVYNERYSDLKARIYNPESKSLAYAHPCAFLNANILCNKKWPSNSFNSFSQQTQES